MTESLLQKLEEKMIVLLTEVESLRKDVHRLNHETAALKFERENNARKLQDLLSLLDSVNVIVSPVMETNVAA